MLTDVTLALVFVPSTVLRGISKRPRSAAAVHLGERLNGICSPGCDTSQKLHLTTENVEGVGADFSAGVGVRGELCEGREGIQVF